MEERTFRDSYDDKPAQPRCSRCGSFLPWTPNGEDARFVGLEDMQTYDDDGLALTYSVTGEYYQPVAYWQCRCDNIEGEVESGEEFFVQFNPPKVGDWVPVPGKPGAFRVVWRKNEAA